MKKIFVLLMSASLITVSAFAKIPAKITDAFHARYSNASNVAWTHNIGNYKASFDMGDYRYNAKFDTKGRWMRSEKVLGQDRLPLTVKNNLRKSKYSEWKIKSSYEEYAPNKKPQYHVTAAKGAIARKSLMFNHRGQLLNG
ncbi:MAG TPA: PepSY-like domain-containing protein [Puia sp.]|nr:PepSY-like domain-containing protein [Puia sp.]